MSKILSFVKPLIEKFPLLAKTYRFFRDESNYQQEPIITPWNFKLSGNRLMASGAFEFEETELIIELLSEVDVLINVGANVGYYCCHALNLGKQVIAVEPMPDNLRYLCRNIDINSWSCEIFPVALSNKIGIKKMYGGSTGASLVKGWAGSSENSFTYVPCTTMDTLLGRRLEGKKVLVIVDVEGAEFWMIQGCSKLLRNNPKPLWFIEVGATEHQPKGISVNPRFADTFQLMHDAGYTAVTADKSQNNIIIEDVVATQNGKKTILSTTHNFIFR
jgi:FkbM family methyltransferase